MKKEYRNVTKTKKAIRDAFADLVYEKKDLYKITVTELIKKANIAKSTFYLHYNDIFSVAEEFENDLITTLKSIIDKTEQNYNSFENSLNQTLEYLIDNQEIYSKVINSSASMFFIDKLRKLLTQQLVAKVSAPNLSKDANIRKAQIYFLANGAIDLAIEYFRGNINVSLEEIKNIVLYYSKIINE